MTREADDTASDAAALSRAGVPWASVPCIECVLKPWPAWPVRPGTPVLFFSSRRAARAYPPEAAGDGSLVTAVAPSTSAWLTEHGHAVELTAVGGAVALAKVVVAAWEARGRPAWHVRYPTSDAGQLSAEQAQAVALLERVGPVDRAVVYETGGPAGLEERLAPWLQSAYRLSFSSPSAVKAFLAACPRGAQTPAAVVCYGASTVRAWDVGRPEGWPPAEPAETSVVDSILSHKERNP